MLRNKRKKLVSWFLLILGLIALVLSIIYTSSITAFIGLSFTFWGVLTLYITNEKYVKQIILDSTIVPSLTDLNQILTELNYQGKGIYLPPKYLKDFETSKVYIPKNKNTTLPTPEEIQQQEDNTFLRNPEALLVIPPGLSLSKLFEHQLRTSFTKVDLKYLQRSLPKLFIEDLEIAENLEIQLTPSQHPKKLTDSVPLIQTKNDTVYVKITNSIYKDLYKETKEHLYIRNTIGYPLCSAIACAIAKASGKPVTIEKTESTEDGNITEVYYRIIEE